MSKRLGLPTITSRFRPLPVLLSLLFLFFLLLLLRTAWITDDAMISFRSVLNLNHGFGATWNVGERVQAYTHPLWFLLLSLAYWVTDDIIYTSLYLSLGLVGLGVALLVLRLAVSLPSALVALSILTCSKAFIEYSTSGLENPLSLLLIIVLFLLAAPLDQPQPRKSVAPGNPEPGPAAPTQRRLVGLFLTGALIATNRLDLALLALPLIVATAAASHRRRIAGAALLGALPLLAWLSFSSVYYGYLLPNTAYAKLAAGIETRLMLREGLSYFADSFQRDPLTLIAIAAGLASALHRPSRLAAGAAAGIVLYLLYVIWIGGDFMSGRFFMLPLFVSTCILARRSFTPKTAAVSAALALALCLLSETPIISSPTNFTHPEISRTGVADERGFYYQSFGLLSIHSQLPKLAAEIADWHSAGERKVLRGHAIGLQGLTAGPDAYIIDVLGLSDPLLSRLPQGYGDNWRVGHYQRKVPRGYPESLHADRNRIENPEIASLYEQVRLVTTGPLFSWSRARAIAYMNSFGYRDLVEGYEKLEEPEVIDFGSQVYVPEVRRDPEL
jgi:arabinofuranosyltransferase